MEFRCNLCSSEFDKKRYLQDHLLRFHKIKKSNKNSAHGTVCMYCKKVFASKSSLSKHVLRIHEVRATIVCQEENCDEKFRCMRELRAHLSSKHGMKSSDKRIHRNKHSLGIKKCIECNIRFGNLRKLHEHLSTHHNLNYVEKEITFPNMIAFKKWKLDIERRDRTFFSKCNRLIYRCHRSGYYKAIDCLDKLKMNNSAGSVKIGNVCTANMAVSEYAHGVRVKYCLQHYGHGQGTTFVQLSAEEQAAVDENVAKGIPLQEQLDDIKHAQSLDEHFQARLIKTKDVHFLNSASASEIYNAGMSAIEYVEQWVRVCSEMEDSPILLYRQEGIGAKTEDLMLIIMTEFQKHILMTSTKEVVCLDSHHCVKKGRRFLTALAVMDDQDIAFPVAFCISSKMNKSSMLEFVSSVKESTGPLSFSYFMSNDDKVYYEAWKEVMQDESKWIWNTGYFDDNIRKHLVLLLKHVPTRQKTYLLLRKIMECNNQDVFVTMLKHFLSSLSKNPLCNDFAKFFESQYGSNQEMWACCYRKDLKFSTNFYLEYLHKTLVYCVSKCRYKQFDKSLMVLMKYLRFKMIDRLSNMLDEEKIDLAKKTITVCHSMGLDVECENINSLSDDKIWLIRSENEVDAYVTREYESCPELCDLRCADCDVCVHMYSCTCVHSMINANMCKHIHAVVWKFLTPHFSPPASPLQDSCDNIGDIPDSDPGIPDKDQNLLQSVLNRMQGIYKQVRMNKCQLNKNSLSEVLVLLDRCYQICSNVDVSFSFESKSTQTDVVPSNPESCSSERQKLVSSIKSSSVSNPFLNLDDNAIPFSEKQKAVVTQLHSVSSSVAKSLSTSKRSRKRIHISLGPVHDSASKHQRVTKPRQRHRLKRIHFPDVSSSVTTSSSKVTKTTVASSGDLCSVSVNNSSNSFSPTSCVTDSTATKVAVLKNPSDAPITTISISPSSNFSGLTTNSSDKIPYVKKTSDKVSGSCKVLNPSSSENHRKFDAPCVISSIYSLKYATNSKNDVNSDASVAHSLSSMDEYKSEVLLDFI